ncbi:11001_t:CDS:1, partial [Gigaspora rosea]
VQDEDVDENVDEEEGFYIEDNEYCGSSTTSIPLPTIVSLTRMSSLISLYFGDIEVISSNEVKRRNEEGRLSFTPN